MTAPPLKPATPPPMVPTGDIQDPFLEVLLAIEADEANERRDQIEAATRVEEAEVIEPRVQTANHSL